VAGYATVLVRELRLQIWAQRCVEIRLREPLNRCPLEERSVRPTDSGSVDRRLGDAHKTVVRQRRHKQEAILAEWHQANARATLNGDESVSDDPVGTNHPSELIAHTATTQTTEPL